MDLNLMQALNTLLTRIQQFPRDQFRRYLIAFFVGYSLIIGFLVIWHIRSVNNRMTRIKGINKKYLEVRNLLERYEMVKKQKAEVDAVLEKDKDFKIGGYFNTVLQQLNLLGKKTREPETSAEELENGYREIKLYATFNGLNMKQLIDLLDALEQNERIYTKEVEVYKPEQDRTINVNLLIATLEPKEETVE